MIEWWVYLAVLGGLLVAGWLVDVIVKRGIAALVLGDDGRTSASKLQAALWTFAVLWALISLLAGAPARADHRDTTLWSAEARPVACS